MKLSDGCLLIMLSVYLIVGASTFEYCLWSIFGKDVPWYADLAAGFVLGQLTIPMALLCWIARLCGVEVPFID